MQNLQVLGYVRLIPIQARNKFANRLLTCLKLLQDAEPVWLSESAKAASNEVQHFVAHLLFFHILAYISMYAYIQVMEICDMDAIIDVREYPEFASGHIAEAQLVPLDTLARVSEGWSKHESILLVCKRGKRAEQVRQELAGNGFTSVSVLAGGIDGWRAAGKPLVIEPQAPWSMERQVRTVAGSLILVTLALVYAFSLKFAFGTAFVGAGLVFAGVSDTCMMGMVLAKMPWNRARASAV